MLVEVWTDVVCPWCYIGKRRLEQALDEYERLEVAAGAPAPAIEVVYRSFELDPTAAPTVTVPVVDKLAQRYGASPSDVADRMRRVEQVAAGEGLEYHLRDQVAGSTFDAHRLIHHAKARGIQAELVERLSAAYFVERRSIFDTASLVDLGSDVGLPADEVQGVLASDAYAAAVRADQEEGHRIGVTGVPFFVVDRKVAAAGAHPAEALVELLQRAEAAAA